MKRALYISTIACCMLAMAGCGQAPKRVLPTDMTGVPGQPGQTDTVYSGQAAGAQADTSKSPLYLDITDNKDISIDQVTTETVSPSMTYLNDRIFEYGQKLDRWKELDKQSLSVALSQQDTEQMVSCFKKLQSVLNRYTTLQADILQNRSVSGSGEVSSAEMHELQQTDIEFLESPCGRLLSSADDKGAGWAKREEEADLPQIETLIKRYSDNNEFEEVVQVWLQIPPSQVERVDLQTKLRYGSALMYLHQEEQAATVYQQIIDQMSASDEQSADLVPLRKVLADLYTASGNYPAAQTQYKKISEDYAKLGEVNEWSKLQTSILDKSEPGSPELKAYSALLRNYLGFIPEKDGYKIVWQAEEFLTNYPYSAVSSNVNTIKARAQEKADAWMNTFTAKVDQLVAEKKFQEAIDMVETAPVELIDEQKRNSLKDKKDDFVLAEAVDRETEKLANVQELQRKWNSGMLLVKAERFSEAITLFTEMLGTEYDAKAKEKITEISLLAANEERRKAADLFIRYTKTTDLESRKKLLVESRKILQDILVNYPDVDIADKVRGNIQRVEQEMTSIDPTLLQSTDNGLSGAAANEVDAFDIDTRREDLPEAQPPIVVQPLPQ